MLYYTYTRPKKSEFNYPDPVGINDETFTITETPFGNDKTYLCYIESEEPNLTGKLNSSSEFNRQKLQDIDKATQWCNDNIFHNEGEEFTNDGTIIVDNRILDELV